MVHWSKTPEMRKIVINKISRTQFKKGILYSKKPFKIGHIPWNKGLKGYNYGHFVSDETKIKISNALKNKSFPHMFKHCSDETKMKISKSNKGKKNPLVSIYMKNRIISEETRLKMSKARKGKKYPKHSKLMKKLWMEDNYREKVIKNTLKSLIKRPTSIEQQMCDIINKYNLPYKYVGDGSFLIGFKNPDFVNINGNKICLEVRPKRMCMIWNKCSPEEYENKRKEHYAKFGWECIVLFSERKFNENEVLSIFKKDLRLGIG